MTRNLDRSGIQTEVIIVQKSLSLEGGGINSTSFRRGISRTESTFLHLKNGGTSTAAKAER